MLLPSKRGRSFALFNRSAKVSISPSKNIGIDFSFIRSLFFSERIIPPPVATMEGFSFRTFSNTSPSTFLKYSSPLVLNISPILIPSCFSIISSVSINDIPSILESSLPTVVFPEPIIPIRTICLSIFLSTFHNVLLS